MRVTHHESVTVVRKNRGHGLLPGQCVCCHRDLSKNQQLEMLDCCSSAQTPKVAHQTCLTQALMPKQKTIMIRNHDGTTMASTILEPATCPSCGTRPSHTHLSSSLVALLQDMDPLLAEEVRGQLSLKEIIRITEKDWTQANFLARFGSRLESQHVIRLLDGVTLLNGSAKQKAVLHDLVQHHNEAVFQYVLSLSHAGESWRLVSSDDLLEPIRKNHYAAQLTTLLIKKLLQDKTNMDPVSTEGKLIWKAFIKDLGQQQALISALNYSKIIEHKFALAHVYRDGVIGSHRTGIQASETEAFKQYWQVIKGVMGLAQVDRQSIVMLEEACRYLVANITKGQVEDKACFIQAVHFLANNVKNIDGLLQFVYKDFLQHGARPNDFLNAYTPKYSVCKNSEGSTPLHLVARFWPAAGVGQQDMLAVMRSLQKNGVDVNAIDKDDDRALHHFCRCICESKVMTAKDRSELLVWIVDSMKASVNVANKAGKTPLQLVAEIWLQANMDEQYVIAVVKFLATKTDLNQHGMILRTIIESWCMQKIDKNKLVDTVVFLLQNGANANHGSNKQPPLLYLVAMHWLLNKVDVNLILRTMQQFVIADADVNARGNCKQAVLATICQEWIGVESRMPAVSQAVQMLAPKTNPVELAHALEVILTDWTKNGITTELRIDNMTRILQREINVNHRTATGDSLLHLVVKNWFGMGASTAIEMLVRANVSINALDANHDTVLHCACVTWPGNTDSILQCIQHLKGLGASTQVANREGDLPIHKFFKTRPRFVNAKEIETAFLALQPKDIDQANLAGETLLHIVCGNWSKQEGVQFELMTSTVALLFSHGANAYVSTRGGDTPLHLICQLGQWTNGEAMIICRTLLQKAPAMINATNNAKVTPLHLFARLWLANVSKDLFDNGQILEHLDEFLRNGASVNAADNELSTPLHLLAHFWVQQGATAERMLQAIVKLKDRQVNLDAISSIHHSLVMIVGKEWIKYIKAPQVLAALMQIEQLGANLRAADFESANLLHHVANIWAQQRSPVALMQSAFKYLLGLNVNYNAQNSKGESPLHIICRHWLSYPISVAETQQTLELFFDSKIKMELSDKTECTAFLCVAKLWLQQGASYPQMLATLRRMIELGASSDLKDGDGRNILSYFVEDWAHRVGDNQLFVFNDLFTLAPYLDVNLLVQGASPVHIICREWPSKRVPFHAVNNVICGLIGKKANLNVKDALGDTPLQIMAKEWIGKGVSFEEMHRVMIYCILNGVTVNTVDAKNKSLLHHVFEKWSNALTLAQLGLFIELMRNHQADFNIRDSSGCTPIFYLFTQWKNVTDDEQFFSILNQLDTCGIDYGVENLQGVTLVHLASLRASHQAFGFVLNKFPSPDRVIAFAAAAKFEQSLLGHLNGRVQDSDEKFGLLMYYLLSNNLPLGLDMVNGRNFWKNLLPLNRLDEFDRFVSVDGNAEHALHLARFYRDDKVLKREVDLDRAHHAYELTMRKIFTATVYQFKREDLAVLDEIHEFGHNKVLKIIKVKRNDFITEAERAALGMLFVDVNKAIAELEKLATKSLLRDASMFACIVLARHFETGLLLPNADPKRALEHFMSACKMVRPAGELDRFLSACRQCALDGIGRLAEELEEASVHLLAYFAKEQRLDMAEIWYSKLNHKTPEAKAMMGKLCVELDQADLAIAQYHYIPALITRAEKACAEKRFPAAVNDYCRILLLARGDAKLHKMVVNALFKIRDHVLQDQFCGAVIVDVMINVISGAHFDRATVDKLLSAYGMERLFSENACQKQKHVPALFKPLNKAIEAGKRVYTSRYAEIYLHIMSDALYNHFKQRFEEGEHNEQVVEMISAIVNGESPLPPFLLNDKFNERIAELNRICAAGLRKE